MFDYQYAIYTHTDGYYRGCAIMHYYAHTQEAYLVLLPDWNCMLIARLEDILLNFKKF